MKRNCWKIVVLLMLVATLLAGTMSACCSKTPDAEFPVWTNPNIAELSSSPNDEYYAGDFQWALEVMELEKAWDISTGSSTIRVGVIDSGVDITHPDLQNRVNADLSESFVPGYSPLEDSVSHGTHVAGIIGAQGNDGIGVTGVCWDVEIVSLRVCGEDDIPNMNAVINAINSANSKGISILNLSLSTSNPAYKTPLEDAINNFNGLVVCAAGNRSSANDVLNNDSRALYPANICADNLICVGASTRTDAAWEHSHYGANSVDIFAPGSSIFNCYSTSACGENCNSSTTHIVDDYHLLSGTSMAAPQVAGVAALMLAIHPELTAEELKTIIMYSSETVIDSSGNNVFRSLCVSGGRINAFAALSSSSLHNFTRWQNVNFSYHERICTTCGYTQQQAHSDCWDSVRSRCIACGRTGIIPVEPSVVPIEEEEAVEGENIDIPYSAP